MKLCDYFNDEGCDVLLIENYQCNAENNYKGTKEYDEIFVRT